MALVFVLLGVLGLLFTGHALSSRHYRRLSRSFRIGAKAVDMTGDEEPADPDIHAELADSAARPDRRDGIPCPQGAEIA